MDVCELTIDFHAWIKAMCNAGEILACDLVIVLKSRYPVAQMNLTECLVILMEGTMTEAPPVKAGHHCYVVQHMLDLDPWYHPWIHLVPLRAEPSHS